MCLVIDYIKLLLSRRFVIQSQSQVYLISLGLYLVLSQLGPMDSFPMYSPSSDIILGGLEADSLNTLTLE